MGPTYRTDNREMREYTRPIAEPNGFAIIDAAGDLHLRKFCDYCDVTTSTPDTMDAHIMACHKCADCGGYAKLTPWYDYATKPPTQIPLCPECMKRRKMAEAKKRRDALV